MTIYVFFTTLIRIWQSNTPREFKSKTNLESFHPPRAMRNFFSGYWFLRLTNWRKPPRSRSTQVSNTWQVTILKFHYFSIKVTFWYCTITMITWNKKGGGVFFYYFISGKDKLYWLLERPAGVKHSKKNPLLPYFKYISNIMRGEGDFSSKGTLY